jgi:hypothetical protein
MAILNIKKHRYWPTGNHLINTDDVASTTRINEYYTEISLNQGHRKTVVAMNKIELDNLFSSVALREGKYQSTEKSKNKSASSNETSTNSPKMRRIYRRRIPGN